MEVIPLVYDTEKSAPLLTPLLTPLQASNTDLFPLVCAERRSDPIP
jgi:hypothetical protein